MPCAERRATGHAPARRVRRGAVLAAVFVAGCVGPSSTLAPGESGGALPTLILAPPGPEQVVAASPSVARAPTALAPPGPVRNWTEVRQQAALRIMSANPEHVYSGPAPDPLLAIPVLEIELNGDGSVRRIEVLRYPRQARDTLQTAADAVRRAAPFGDVSRLPKPWKFVETFLFDDARKFKPRTLEH